MSRRRREFRFRWLGRRARPRADGLDIAATIFSRAKQDEPDFSNADYAALSHDGMRLTIADGVSRSYRPRKWAIHVVEGLNRSGAGNVEKDIEKLARVFAGADEATLEWNERVMRERYGSQATVLTVGFRPTGSGRISGTAFSVGDCMMYVGPAAGALSSLWPFSSTTDLPSKPSRICDKEPFVRGDVLGPWTFEAERSDRILVMTDAMGRALLKGLDSRRPIDEIFPFLDSGSRPAQRQAAFLRWAHQVVDLGTVEDDDLTIVEVTIR